MERARPIGVCALCLRTAELCDSHLVPKSLYRVARAADHRAHPDPVLLTSTVRRQTSFQATQYLLCAECEKRFDQNGEDWVMRHCYRGRDRFRLRELLQRATPIHVDEENTIFNAASVAGMEIEKAVYFCVSVFWRAAVRSWESSSQRYEGIRLGPKYQQEIRAYLLGDAALPENAAVMFIVSGLPRPHLSFNFPDTTRIDSSHAHTLHIPGLTFQLGMGGQPSAGARETCIVRSEFHPIFVCKDGDERVQRQVLRMMGKKAPVWAQYPLVNGVV
jgi:hypothetical protein